jgi:DNA-binding PadR family transcriptional regulator
MARQKPVARLVRSLTYGNIWLSILSLMKSRKLYAYVLPAEIEKKFSFQPSKLMTYFVLYKLEGEGLISSAFEGRRKYYELTAKGRAALTEGKRVLSSLAKRL